MCAMCIPYWCPPLISECVCVVFAWLRVCVCHCACVTVCVRVDNHRVQSSVTLFVGTFGTNTHINSYQHYIIKLPFTGHRIFQRSIKEANIPNYVKKKKEIIFPKLSNHRSEWIYKIPWYHLKKKMCKHNMKLTKREFRTWSFFFCFFCFEYF